MTNLKVRPAIRDFRSTVRTARDQTRVRKTILLLIVCLLATNVFGQQRVAATDTNALKQQLQTKLDEWHKAGKFPGATHIGRQSRRAPRPTEGQKEGHGLFHRAQLKTF